VKKGNGKGEKGKGKREKGKGRREKENPADLQFSLLPFPFSLIC